MQWHFSQVQRQPPCRGCSACLGSHHMTSLANRTQVTVEIVVARSHNCTRSQNPERCPFQEKSRLLPKTVSEMAKTSPQKGFLRGNLACSYCCKKVDNNALVKHAKIFGTIPRIMSPRSYPKRVMISQFSFEDAWACLTG